MYFYTNVCRYGNTILYRGYKNGKQFFAKEKYQPILFLPSKEEGSNDWKSLEGEKLEPFYPGGIRESEEFIETYKDVANFSYYGMENWVYNFIAEKFDADMTYDFNQIRVGLYDIETECGNGFPHADKAEEEILMISITRADKVYVFSTEKHGKFYGHLDNVVSKTYATEEQMLKAFTTFFSAVSYDIISGWNSDGFDLPYIINRMKKIVGEEWVKKLSPWGIIREKTIPGMKGDINTYEIYGVNHIDYMSAYIKFSTSKPDNYKLDTIGWLEVQEKKLDYSLYGSLHNMYLEDFQKFGEYNVQDTLLLGRIDKKKRILELIFDLAMQARVNVIDAFKQTRMWDAIFYNHLKKKGIIIPSRPDTASKISFEGGYVKETVPGMYNWITSFDLDGLYPHLIMQYNISPETWVTKLRLRHMLAKEKDSEVAESMKYLYDFMGDDNCLPCNIPEGNMKFISEKLVACAKKLNFSLAANGTLFRKDIRGFIPELMEKLYNERKQFKAKMLEIKDELERRSAELTEAEKEAMKSEIARLDVAQNNRKVSLNSAYGSLSQVGFRFFFRELARAITLSGQMSIRWAENRLNKFLNNLMKMEKDWVTAVDTDSVHISMDDIMKVFSKKKPNATKEEMVEFLDNFAKKKVQPEIDNLYNDLKNEMNAYEQKMKMKREAIADRGVYLAKKKYIYNVFDLEGVRFKEPLIKVTGVEIVRSSTPEFCRNKLKEASRIILQETPETLQEYMKKVKDEFLKLPVEEVAKPSGVKGLEKYSDRNTIYVKATPIHVRGSILYNNLLKKMGLDNKYELITEGDKIRFTYLDMPNPLYENVISFPVILPKEFGLHEYVDMNMQFEKTFYGPLKSICDAAGWSPEKKNTLEDLFS